MRIFKRNELKLLWPFYLAAVFAPLLYFAPIFFVVYFRQLGFSFFQMGLIIGAFPLAQLIFEIPTGAIADIYGRKFSTLLGYFLSGVSLMLLFFINSFVGIILLFAFFGFSYSFLSGAREAWITDLLNKKGKHLLHEFFVKNQSIDGFSIVLGGLLGALLVKTFGVAVIWPVGALAFWVAGIFHSFGTEYYKKHKTKLIKQSKEAISYSSKHPVMFYLLIASFILSFAVAFGSLLAIVPLFQEFGFADHQFGYLLAGINLVIGIAPLVSKKFYVKYKEKQFIVVSLLLASITTLMILFAKTIISALIIILLGTFFFQLRRPAFRVYFQRFAPTKLRATIGSLNSMLVTLGSVVAAPIVGLVIDSIGPRYSFFISGVLMIPAVIVYSLIKEP